MSASKFLITMISVGSKKFFSQTLLLFICLFSISVFSQKITYSGNGFTENADNIGNVSGTLRVHLTGDSFNHKDLTSHVTIGNIPNGLTPKLTRGYSFGNYTANNQPNSLKNKSFSQVVYGNGNFVAVAKNLIITSTNGTNWTSVNIDKVVSKVNWRSITYGANGFVAIGNRGERAVFIQSTDGNNWRVRYSNSDGEFWKSIAYGAGKYVVLSREENYIATSTDGIRWNLAEHNNIDNYNWTSITYGANGFVAVSKNSDGAILYSKDGNNWGIAYQNLNRNLSSVAYGNGMYVAVSDRSNTIIRSSDGRKWSKSENKEQSIKSSKWGAITYFENHFFIIGTSTAFSTDGINWKSAGNLPNKNWNATVAYGNGKIVSLSKKKGVQNFVTVGNFFKYADLSFQGKAIKNDIIDNVSNLTFNFSNSAFVGNNAGSISGATGPASSNIGITFKDPETFTFTGSTGDAWNNTNNWNNKKIPQANSRVVIPANKNVKISNSKIVCSEFIAHATSSVVIEKTGSLIIDRSFNNSSNSFVIESDSDSSGVIYLKGNSSGSQKVTYIKRGCPTRKWFAISSPVSGQKIVDFIANNKISPLYGGAYYALIKMVNGNWVYYTPSNIDPNEEFVMGQSYFVAILNDTITFKGNLIAIDTQVNIDSDKWNLIGNPFTAYISANKQGADNFMGDNSSKFKPLHHAIYVWNVKQQKYVAYNYLSPDLKIEPAGSFFIRTNTNSRNFLFKKGLRSDSKNTASRITKRNPASKIDLFLTSNKSNVSVKTTIEYRSQSSKGIDEKFDVANYKANTLDVFTLFAEGKDKTELTIQSLPEANLKDVIVPVGVKAKASESITFSASILNIPNSLDIYLEDKVEGVMINLSKGKKHTVTFLKDVDGGGRFYIHTKNNANRFTGTVNTLWNVAGNWSDNKIPNASSNVQIPNGQIVTIENDAAALNLHVEKGASLTIRNGKSLVVDSKFVNDSDLVALESNLNSSATLYVEGVASGNGKVTYTKGELKAKKWYLLAVPVSGLKIIDFINDNPHILKNGDKTKYAIATYDNNNWKYYQVGKIDPNEEFIPGIGYSMASAIDGGFKFKGQVISKTVSSKVKPNQWQLIGNPYTSNISGNQNNAKNFLKQNEGKLENMRSSVYMWSIEQGKYVAYNYSQQKHLIIPPGQAFFIKTSSSAQNFQLVKETRLKSKATKFYHRSTQTSIPTIQISVENSSKQNSNIVNTRIEYRDNANTGIDNTLDVLNYGKTKFDVYTKFTENKDANDDKYNLTVQSLSTSDYDKVIPLGIVVEQGETITFSSNTINFSNEYDVFLEDKKLGTMTKLSEKDATYQVDFTEAVNGAGRFYIHTTKASVLSTEDQTISTELVNIYSYNNTLHIKGIQNPYKVVVYNINGKQVFAEALSSSQNTIQMPSTLSKGMYIVNVISEGIKKTSKIIL